MALFNALPTGNATLMRNPELNQWLRRWGCGTVGAVMTKDVAARVRSFRARAKEIRAKLEDIRNPDAKALMERLAQGYEHMADLLERPQKFAGIAAR